MRKSLFSKLDVAVSQDRELQKTTAALYSKLLGLAGVSRKVRVSIYELSILLACSCWTVRRHLSKLIKMGLIERILCKSRYN